MSSISGTHVEQRGSQSSSLKTSRAVDAPRSRWAQIWRSPRALHIQTITNGDSPGCSYLGAFNCPVRLSSKPAGVGLRTCVRSRGFACGESVAFGLAPDPPVAFGLAPDPPVAFGLRPGRRLEAEAGSESGGGVEGGEHRAELGLVLARDIEGGAVRGADPDVRWTDEDGAGLF